MSALIKYDQARHALAACRSVDEVKDIRDKSEAMRLYAKQAQDTELEQWTAEIKFRAQCALGEMTAALPTQKGGFGIVPTGGKHKAEVLAEAGISTSTANRYEKLAAIPKPAIEEAIAKSREAGKPVSSKTVLAQLAPKIAPRSTVNGAGASTTPTVATPRPAEPTPGPVLLIAPTPAAGPSLQQQVAEQMDRPTASVSTEDDQGDDDQGDLVERLHAENVALRDKLEAAEARVQHVEMLLGQSDLAAQVEHWRSNFEGIAGRNAGLTKKLNEIEPEFDYQGELLQQIRKALGVERNRDILPTLSARRAA